MCAGTELSLKSTPGGFRGLAWCATAQAGDALAPWPRCFVGCESHFLDVRRLQATEPDDAVGCLLILIPYDTTILELRFPAGACSRFWS